MGKIIFKKNLADFSVEESLRCDFKFFSLNSDGDKVNYKSYFELINPKDEPVDITELQNVPYFKYAEIGDVSSEGKVFFKKYSFKNISIGDWRILNKISIKKDILNPKKGDILISKTRPYLKKNVLITNENNGYYTKAFIQIRPKINPEILYLLIMTLFAELFNSVARIGTKGYPTISDTDVQSILFPKIDLKRIKDTSLLEKAKQIQNTIANYKNTIIKTEEKIEQTRQSLISLVKSSC